ncbi:hypothetical protein [Photobacterium phosphoreum]|jgi:hypothetical protein|uniref:hypothetical protein n=1 Tax=Photobacterium phosphoreum TaxID=659 RepID=UPI001E43F784|nr:hypothetical protein [Photobacterium phosphoreum]MCD9513246.1 hypothetical protein [Photobacterium phosphoreum]
MKKIILIITAIYLSGCSVTVPVIAKSNNKVFIGQAKAGLTQSEGIMSIYNDESNIECHGTYDQWSTDSLLRVKLKCSDGSIGTANIMRDSTSMNGSGQGVLLHPNGKKEIILAAFGERVLIESKSPAFWKTVNGSL